MPGISPCHKTNKPAHAASARTSPRNKQLGRDVQEGACTLARRYFPPAACLDLKSVGQRRNDFGRRQKPEVIWRSSFPCPWGCALRGDLLEAQKAASRQDQQANCSSWWSQEATGFGGSWCSTGAPKHSASIVQALGVGLANAASPASPNRSSLAERCSALINAKQRACTHTSRNPHGTQA